MEVNHTPVKSVRHGENPWRTYPKTGRPKAGCRRKIERPASRLIGSTLACGPPGGLFGIDQEVVTLRGLYGNSGFVESTIPTDLRQAEFNPYFTGSVRAVAP